MKFIDTAQIHVRAGDGGSGIISFRREKYIPKGGPDGGNGGRGGDIIFRANRHLGTLLDFQYRRNYRAADGGHGAGARKTGKSGGSVIIEVPVGTVIRDTTTQGLLGDLVRHGEELLVARGGRGGRGNAEFATSTNQAPRQYEPGGEGEERNIELELKLIADVGLVGLPNAGKSTLISVISAARPKIADYPFTTLVPNLGIVQVDGGQGFVVADIPGLIEGAHLGKGLGIQFLRHIERTRVLVFLLDGTREDPKADFALLLKELKLFKADLAKRPRLIAITKADALPPSDLAKARSLAFGRTPVLAISAVAGTGIRDLVERLGTMLRRTAPKVEPEVTEDRPRRSRR